MWRKAVLFHFINDDTNGITRDSMESWLYAVLFLFRGKRLHQLALSLGTGVPIASTFNIPYKKGYIYQPHAFSAVF